MSRLKNIIWVGTGKVGLPMLKALAATKLFVITLLVRNDPATYSSLPTALSAVHQVDYSNPDSLAPYFRGQDAVIVFSTFAPKSGFDKKHIALVNAAIEAGVKYFIPSEWALDTAGIMGSTSERYGPTLPTNYVLAPKRVTHNYLLNRAAEGVIRFAAVYPGVLPEVAVKTPLFKFDFATKTAVLPDSGIHSFPASSLASLATAIITLFTSPDLIANRFYHIADTTLTQADILDLIEAETGTTWKRENYSVAERRERAAERMRQGVFGIEEFVGSLATPFFGGLQVWTHRDNEVLGVGEGGKRELGEGIRAVIGGL